MTGLYLPVVENGFKNVPTVQVLPNEEKEDSDEDFSDSDNDASIYETEEAEFEEQVELDNQNEVVHCEIHPRRQRQASYLPGSIPWGSLKFNEIIVVQ